MGSSEARAGPRIRDGRRRRVVGARQRGHDQRGDAAERQGGDAPATANPRPAPRPGSPCGPGGRCPVSPLVILEIPVPVRAHRDERSAARALRLRLARCCWRALAGWRAGSVMAG